MPLGGLLTAAWVEDYPEAEKPCAACPMACQGLSREAQDCRKSFFVLLLESLNAGKTF